MALAGFEPATPATKRPQTYALNSVVTGIGIQDRTTMLKSLIKITTSV
jgi:hypothetical protein